MPSLVVAALLVAVFGVFVAIAYRRRWHWTGLPAARVPGEDGSVGRPAKTLWDWLQLFGIPVALAGLAFLLNHAQSSRDQRREDKRAAQQRATAVDAEGEDTLHGYLAQMSDLMLDRRLLHSPPGADVREVARTITLSTVRRLDASRKGFVLRFLVESGLLRREKHGAVPLSAVSVDLSSSDLSGANLSAADLTRANLSQANLHTATLDGAALSWANLRHANLSGASLDETDLDGANLVKANLSGVAGQLAQLHYANLRGANLRGAILLGAELGGANLIGADLRAAQLPGTNLGYEVRTRMRVRIHGRMRRVIDIVQPASLIGADLSAADLSGTNLRQAVLTRANLRQADLTRANLRQADLRQADLSGANLTGANLRGALGANLARTHGKPAHDP